MAEKLRKSGIDIIGDIPWGTHFCQFYQTKEDLMDMLVPYFKAGLENNELCIWITSQPLKMDEAKEALRQAVPDLDIYLEKGQIEIIPYTHCIKEGIFDPERVLNEWVKKLNQALASGYDGLRLTGNTFWLEKKDWNDFIDYEKKVGAVISNYHMIALCTYSLDMRNVTEAIDIVSSHQFTLVKKEGKWERIENSGRKDITESEWAEDALRQNEERVRLKSESIISLPAQEVANLELAEIIDTQAIQSLMDDFYKLVHIPMGLNDLKGNILVGVGWQDICTKFHRVHPGACKHCVESNIKLSAGVAPGEFKMYKCKNNMWDIVTPIIVGGQHVGDIYAGQFFFEDEPLDYELFRSQARQYGFNEKEYIAALEKVPRLSREAVDTGMAFFMTFANMLSQLSYSNIKLAQSLTERDTLVNALRESDERFRSVLENSLDAAYRRNLQTDCCDYMSPVVEQITGFSVQEVSAMNINEVLGRIHPDDRPRVAAERAQALDAGHGTIEYRFKCKDGKYCWIADRFKVIKDQDGKPLFGGGIVRDITELKKVEEALKKAYNNLEEKVKERTAKLEEAYMSLVENERRLSEAQKMAHIGNWDWNLVTDEMYWSDETYRIFGLTPREFGSSYNVILSRTHPNDRGYVDNAVKRSLNGKPFSIDHRIISTGGEDRVIHAQGEVIFDEKNSPIRMRGTVQDITERKKAEDKIQTLLNAIESSNDAIVIYISTPF